MRLATGIVGDAPGWQLLLRQEGIPHSVANSDLQPEQYSAIVVSDTDDRQAIGRVRSYLDAGGGVLCSGKMYSAITMNASSSRHVRFISPEPNSIYPGIGLVDVGRPCDLPTAANSLRTDENAAAAFVGPVGAGMLIALPFDAGSIAGDSAVSRRSFYARRRRLPFERVSSVSKSGVRKLVSRSLEVIHHRRGLPFVHVWYYPSGASTACAFRVDTDDADEREIRNLHDLAAGWKVPVSWYVHVKAHERYCDLFREMPGDEIGVHCYEHKIHGDADSTRRDIRRAIEVLHSVGLSPRGYAAPYGIWNDAVSEAIVPFHFEYSSEFSYDYDNLPSWPMGAAGFSETLQIPIHPISIGSLRRQGFSEEEMIDYFSEAVELKMASHDPLIFYHHPKNGHHRVLEQLFGMMRQAEIPAMTMSDIASWWRRRQHVEPQMTFSGSLLHMKTTSAERDVRLHLTRADGTEAMIPASPQIDFNRIEWKPVRSTKPMPADMTRIRKFNPWIPINRIEDSISKLMRPRR